MTYGAYKNRLAYDLELDKDEGCLFAERMLNTHVSWEPLLSGQAVCMGYVIICFLLELVLGYDLYMCSRKGGKIFAAVVY